MKREVDRCTTASAREAYLAGWWIGCTTYNVEGEHEEAPTIGWEGSGKGSFMRGMSAGLRFNRELRAALTHRREELREDPTLWARILGDEPEEVKQVARDALAEVDRLGLAEGRLAARPTGPAETT